MNLRLRFGRAKLVLPTNVQQQRVTQVLRFVETFLDTDAVITDRAIRLVAHRQEIREIPAHTKAERAGAAAARRMLSQKLERRGGVFHRLCLIDLLVKLDGSFPVVAFVSELDAGLYAPEQIGNQRDKPMRRIPVSDTAQEAIDAIDLLEHDEAWSITTRRQGKIRVELPTIESCNFCHALNNTRTIGFSI